MSLLPERRYSPFPPRSSTGRIPADTPSHSRLSSLALRSRPYHKRNSFPPEESHVPISSYRKPSGNADTRWNHDLFEADSNLYGPRVNFQPPMLDIIKLSAPQPSPSLRPFGSSGTTPAAQAKPASAPSVKKPSIPAPISASTLAAPQTIPTFKPQSKPVKPNSGLSLLSRIQSDHSLKELLPSDLSSGLRSHYKNANDNHRNPVVDSHHLNRFNQSTNQEIQNHPRNSTNQQAYDEAMAKYLNGPVILEVANLADGTSAEDVKTAFADFGEIQECATEEGPRQGNQPTLKAKMIFTHKAQAEKAVEALNGALADGLTLAVKIIGRPTKRPERADFMTVTSPETKTTQANEDVTMEDAEQPLPIVPTGRLRSEVVAQCDPRASIQVEPKPIAVYQAEQPKPISRNMLSRVQPLSSDHQSSSFSHHHHGQQRNGFGNPNSFGGSHHHFGNRTKQNESPKSLLARLNPI